MRIAYAVGDASVLKDFACSAGAVQIGVNALQRGAPLIADVRMVVTGIDRRRARRGSASRSEPGSTTRRSRRWHVNAASPARPRRCCLRRLRLMAPSS